MVGAVKKGIQAVAQARATGAAASKGEVGSSECMTAVAMRREQQPAGVLSRSKNMKILALSLGVVCLACGAAVASEEDILSPHKVTLAADGGKAFGEVSAAIEATTDAGACRIKSITLTVDGKPFVVPKEQFSDLHDPLIATAEFRTEAGHDAHPWLYLTFQLAKSGAASVGDRPRVYIRFQNGEIKERFVRQPQD